MNRKANHDEAARDRDRVAAMLSAVPGLGHLYKGHYWMGSGIVLVGLAVAVWAGTLISLAYAVGAIVANLGFAVKWLGLLLNPITVCLGLLPAFLFWVAAALDAFDEPDLQHGLSGPGRRSKLTRRPSTSARPRSTFLQPVPHGAAMSATSPQKLTMPPQLLTTNH